MGNKAKLPINVTISTNSDGERTVTYSGTGTKGDPNKQDPSVTSSGTVEVHEDTNITFTLETGGWTFPTSGTLIKIKLGDDTTFTDFVNGDNKGNFVVSWDSEKSNVLEVEDADHDGTAAGVTHQFCLQVLDGSTPVSLDPNFWNRL